LFYFKKAGISAIHPKKYAKRFVNFIKFATLPEEELNDPVFEPYLKIRESYGIPIPEKEDTSNIKTKPATPKEAQPINEIVDVKKEESNTEKPQKKIEENEQKATNEEIEKKNDIIKNESKSEQTVEESLPKMNDSEDDIPNETNMDEEGTKISKTVLKSNEGSSKELEIKNILLPVYGSTDIFMTPKSDSPLVDAPSEEEITPLPQAHIQTNLSSKRASLKIDPSSVNSGTLA